MIDAESLLKEIQGDDKEKGWQAVLTLASLRPTNEAEKKARAYACCCLAEDAFKRSKVGTAVDWWQETINCEPMNPLYRLAFVARGLMPLGLFRQAINEVNRSIRLDPSNPDAWRILGHIHIAMQDADAAIQAFDKQIELAPDNPVSYLDRVDVALEKADWQTVGNLVEKVLKLGGSQTGNALHQLGLMAFRQGKHEEALELWDGALENNCENQAVAVWNQSNALLSLGRYREGWRKHEARGTQTRDVAMAVHMSRGMPERLFQNEPPPAKLHVHQEMAFGDTMAMARYIPLLVEKGYDVCYEVMTPLIDLMRQSLPGVNVIERAPIYPGLLGVPEFDYTVPDLSLPKLFGTQPDSVPWRGAYLKADSKQVEEYREKLGGRPTIGICWSSGVRTHNGLWLNEYGKRKSIAFDDMWPIIEASPYQLVSLQVGPPREELQPGLYGTEYPILDLLPENPTWADTAALVECLDLVITVDTGLAHLVGGMGKPLWLLMHTEGSWHWMAERPGAAWNEKSPWYPSARLFRQKLPHQWDDVIIKIASELAQRKLAAA